MAKSMVVTLPIVLLLLDVWPLQRIRIGRKAPAAGIEETPLRRILLEKAPMLALSLAVAVVTCVVQQRSHYVATLDLAPLSQRISNALVSYVAYVSNLVWPTKLAVFYPFDLDAPWWQPVAAGLAVLAVSILALRSPRRPYLAVGWFWYLITLTPVIGLVQVGSQARADRYTYLPTVGLLIALTWGAGELVRSRPRLRMAMAAGAVAVCLACAGLTWRQVGYWQDTVSLFRHSLSVTSGNYLGYNILGLALRDQGHLDEAVASYREAIKINPQFEDAHANLSQALLEQGRTGESLGSAAAAARLKPDDEEAQYNVGTALANQGRFEEAVEALRIAVRLKPDYAKAHANLGSALANLGRLDEAIEQFREVLRLEPGMEGARENLDAAMELRREGEGKR
jgi:tetratricopeptide (TPR) repeat protein